MNQRRIIMASGRLYDIPMFDPIVAKHFIDPSSMADTLLSEINEKQIYEILFAGREHLTFLDIGANIGLVSLYAYDSCDRIVAIEPAPKTFEVLKAMTFSLTKIERAHAALAPVDGPCEFFQNDQNTTASSTVNTYGDLTEVMGSTLSSILSIHQLEHVDVCKIDCEGAEVESLTYEQLAAARDVIDSYWIEVHNVPRISWEDTLTKLTAMLHQLDYNHITVKGMALFARK